MSDTNRDASGNRWGAITGYLSVALGVVAGSLERGAPPANAPVEQALAYFVKYRTELLSQSLFFVLSAGALLWFVGCLRSFLQHSEQGSGRLSGVAF
jgi:hypothetical protein